MNNDNNVVLSGSPQSQIVSDAVVSPLRAKYERHANGTIDITDSRGRANWLAGVFQSNGGAVELAMLHRGGWRNKPVVRPQQPGPFRKPGEEKHLSGTAIYGGVIFNHYGHFILETLARWWAVRSFPDFDRLLLHSNRPVQGCSDLPEWSREFFDALALGDKKVQFINEELRVEKLIVAEQGYTIGGFPYGDHLDFLETIFPTAEFPPERPDRIYLSRSGLTKRLVAGEKQLERIFVRNGYQIFHPQFHSVRKQLEIISGAKVVNWFRGSAFFNLYLTRNFKGQAVVLPRHINFEINYQALSERKRITILDRSLVQETAKHVKTDINSVLRLLAKLGVVARRERVSAAEVASEFDLMVRFDNILAKTATTDLSASESDAALAVVLSMICERPVFLNKVIPFLEALPFDPSDRNNTLGNL